MINDPFGPDAAPVNTAPPNWAQRLADADRAARLMDTHYRILLQGYLRATVKAADMERECALLRLRLAKYEPVPAAEPEHPAIAAVAIMQRNGVR